jgi:hypothetical protein
LIPYVGNRGSPGIRRFLFELLPFKTTRKLGEIVDFMDKTSIDILQSKRAALQQGDEAVLKQVGRGKDIMSLLCMYFNLSLVSLMTTHPISVRANMGAKEEDRLPESELIAHITYVPIAVIVAPST